MINLNGIAPSAEHLEKERGLARHIFRLFHKSS